jgi:TP901-1 family phage major tail protein
MKKLNEFDLQLFAEAVQGKRIIYLFRVLSEASSSAAVAMAFATENERTKSKDADSTATKDGSIRTPGVIEQEITATAILAKGDTLKDKLEEAMDNDSLLEIWEANLDEPGTGGNKFKGRYFQGYLTEFTLTSSADEHAEYETTFGINGAGAKGEVTVTAAQQEVASYVFRDTTKVTEGA